MVCPKCKSPVPEGSSFCPRCGVPIATEKHCPKCQSVIAADSVFCPKCGARMAGNPSPDPAPVSPASANPPPAGPAFTPASAPAPAPVSAPPAKKRSSIWISILIVLAAILIGRGAGYLMGSTWPGRSKSTSSAPSTGAQIDTNFNTGVKLKDDFDIEEAISKDYTVSLADATVYTDNEGKPLLIVTYNFTNNSGTSQSFIEATYDKAFQNGVQVSPTLLIGVGSQYNYDAALASKEVQPGVSMKVQRAYTLDHPSAEVEVEVVTHGIDPVTLLQTTVLLPE